MSSASDRATAVELADKLADLRGATVLLETIHENAMVPLSGEMLNAVVRLRQPACIYYQLTEDQREALAYAVMLVGDHVRALTRDLSS